jgi:hypothetical protein
MKPRLWIAWGLIILVSGRAVAQDYRAEPLMQGPPAESLAPEVAGQIAAQGVKVVRGAQTVAEIWPAKTWSVREGFTASNSELYPLQVGALFGVIRYSDKGEDFRGREIPEGVYTVRYGLQPVDGNHLGTSETRDFLLLLPGKEDTNPQPMAEADMFELSPKVTATTHPTMLALLRADGDVKSLPAVRHDDAAELWSVRFAGKSQGKPEDLTVEMVIAGHFPE